ncbi:Imp1-Imp2 [Blastocystis hominis]|uniref:Mitochondrial inner membrane protease subunit 2 n=1 Tax=Blastocystis hominis TaxID=12968 RepID=D8LZZ1_BLAHO|nr:Imp1-Imp2 [Blastocystis hominis]CBK21380.2 Imp1-Imp2 [Blastocystis hominis]|eukprot:XP_012895428.1 Imp1-Imp2 [Blastocystis hominis]
MQPTINPVVEGKNLHEWVLVSKLGAKKYAYNRGDVVMLKSPTDPKRYLVKRIIALPGDWVQLHGNKLIEIEKGHCWVEGDNTKNSIDSNRFGQVPLGLIEGTVKCVIFPFTRMRYLAPHTSPITRVMYKSEDIHDYFVFSIKCLPVITNQSFSRNPSFLTHFRTFLQLLTDIRDDFTGTTYGNICKFTGSGDESDGPLRS